MSQPAEQKPLPVALVDALNKLAGGPHPGFRANHAKGVLVTGTFTPAITAPTLSKAAHFAKPVPVLVRFSDPTGVPNLPDASPDASPHGMAIRFKLPDGGSTDIVSISSNGFPVATPEDFLALLTAISKSGPGVRNQHRSNNFWAPIRRHSNTSQRPSLRLRALQRWRSTVSTRSSSPTQRVSATSRATRFCRWRANTHSRRRR